MARGDGNHCRRRHDFDGDTRQQSGTQAGIANYGVAGVTQQKLRTAVVGATGYAGFELAQLLAKHPHVCAPILFTRNENPVATLDQAYPHVMNGHGTPLHPFSWQQIKREGIDLLFLATPHEASWELVPEAIANGLRVIDLSGAWRLKQKSNRAIYALPENDGACRTRDQ